MEGKLVVISGFSGAGKGTVVKKMVAKFGYSLSISATTRKPRVGEEHGREYYFITKEEFERRIADGDFLEHACYVGNYYGTPLSFTKERLAKGENVILEIDIQGGLEVKKKYPEAILVFMVSPSMEELVHRLRGRGTESEDLILKRVERATEEAGLAGAYDCMVVNRDVEDCAAELDRIIKGEENITAPDAEILGSLFSEGTALLKQLRRE